MLALGLIETKGLIGAIEAADAMLKAADVRLLEKSLASGGLVTITVAGEVAAVQAAVDAAHACLERIPGVTCVSRHVIPRPDAELEHILRLRPRTAEMGEEAAAEIAEEILADAALMAAEGEAAQAEAEAEAEIIAAEAVALAAAAASPVFDREAYKNLSLNKLRQLAASMPVDLSREQLAAANRQTLINAMERATRKEKE